jgi:hypothetical protein
MTAVRSREALSVAVCSCGTEVDAGTEPPLLVVLGEYLLAGKHFIRRRPAPGRVDRGALASADARLRGA